MSLSKPVKDTSTKKEKRLLSPIEFTKTPRKRTLPNEFDQDDSPIAKRTRRAAIRQDDNPLAYQKQTGARQMHGSPDSPLSDMLSIDLFQTDDSSLEPTKKKASNALKRVEQAVEKENQSTILLTDHVQEQDVHGGHHDLQTDIDIAASSHPLARAHLTARVVLLASQHAARAGQAKHLSLYPPTRAAGAGVAVAASTSNGAVSVRYGNTTLTLKTAEERRSLSREDRQLVMAFYPAGSAGRMRQLEFFLDPVRVLGGFEDCMGYSPDWTGGRGSAGDNVWYKGGDGEGRERCLGCGVMVVVEGGGGHRCIERRVGWPVRSAEEAVREWLRRTGNHHGVLIPEY